nr:MAG TPA: hypothetical protein [Caudoviricetes sp.]
MTSESEVQRMAYNYPFPQPAVPGYFNANYMPPQHDLRKRGATHGL